MILKKQIQLFHFHCSN